LNTIRGYILSGFFILTLFIIVISSISYWYLEKASQIRKLEDNIAQNHVDMLRLLNLDYKILYETTITTEFYTEKGETVLHRHDSLFQSIQDCIGKLMISENTKRYDLGVDFELLRGQFDKHEALFDEIIEIQIKRGFKDDKANTQIRERYAK